LSALIVVPLTLFLSRPAATTKAVDAGSVDTGVAAAAVAFDAGVDVLDAGVNTAAVAVIVDVDAGQADAGDAAARADLSSAPPFPGSTLERLRWLKNWCPAMPCTADVLAGGSLRFDEAGSGERFKRQVEACAESCQVARGVAPGDDSRGEFEGTFREARSLIIKGDNAKAVTLLMQLESQRRDDPQVHRALGIAYAKLRENALATKHYRRYLELAPDAPDAPKVKALLDAGRR
jgi:hypothetical protein